MGTNPPLSAKIDGAALLPFGLVHDGVDLFGELRLPRHHVNVTDNDGMEVLNGDVAEALTVLAQAQAILREARETTGKDEP